jgi:hypothetical protein
MIYKSRSITPLDWKLVRRITDVSENYNARHNVTGALLASRTHFLQVLEGSLEDINAVYRRIARDDLHADLSIITFGAVDRRLFEGWAMRGIGAFDLNKTEEAELMDKYGQVDEGIYFPEEEWLALSMINDIKMMKDLSETAS